MAKDKLYIISETEAISKHLAEVDELKGELDGFRPLKEKEYLWSAIQEKLRSEWTYHSNGIEGSTLTLGETIFFLQQGLTVEGKPFKDFLDARNHAEAIDLLYQFVAAERPLTEGFIKEINSLLLLGVSYTKAIDQYGNPTKKAATPGEYKKLPNTVLRRDGTIHEYINPLQVPPEMEYLCQWVNEQIDKEHPVITAAVAHYNMVRIHPFDDGNGRGARILMNLILLKKKYPPAIIKIEERRRYLATMEQADEGNLNPFVELLAQSLMETIKSILEVFQGKT